MTTPGSMGKAVTARPSELLIISSTDQQPPAPPQQQQYYPRHPAFSSNRLGGIRSQSHEGSFQVDRPLAGVLVIGGILLFVSMSLTAAVIVFCKKKNTVFVLQKSEQEDEMPADDSDLELGDFLNDESFDLGYYGWRQSDLELCYTPLALCSLPPLQISVDALSGERQVRCCRSEEVELPADDEIVSVLQNPHARDSRASLLPAVPQFCSQSAIDAAAMGVPNGDKSSRPVGLTRSQTCIAAVASSPNNGRKNPCSKTEVAVAVEDNIDEADAMLGLRLMSNCDRETGDEQDAETSAEVDRDSTEESCHLTSEV